MLKLVQDAQQRLKEIVIADIYSSTDSMKSSGAVVYFGEAYRYIVTPFGHVEVRKFSGDQFVDRFELENSR